MPNIFALSSSAVYFMSFVLIPAVNAAVAIESSARKSTIPYLGILGLILWVGICLN